MVDMMNEKEVYAAESQVNKEVNKEKKGGGERCIVCVIEFVQEKGCTGVLVGSWLGLALLGVCLLSTMAHKKAQPHRIGCFCAVDLNHVHLVRTSPLAFH
jgi:hypothetical protein